MHDKTAFEIIHIVRTIDKNALEAQGLFGNYFLEQSRKITFENSF